MSWAGGHACEACRQFVRKGTKNIMVGERPNGAPRLIHDRARCRQDWAKNGERIKAKWPESKPVTRAIAKVSPRQVKVSKPTQVSTIEMLAAVEVPAEAGGREPQMRMELVQPEKKRRHFWRMKPDLDKAILEFYERHPYRPGSAGRLHAVLQATHPDYLVDATGREVSESALSTYVTRVLRDAAGRKNGKAPEVAAAPPPAYPDHRHALESGKTLVNGILALVQANDVATLDALLDLMRGNVR